MRNAFHLAVLAFMVLALPAQADVSFNQHMNVEAAGAMSLLASEGDIATLVANDKSHTESTISMKSRLAGMFSGSGKTASIVRLDKGLTWNLFPDKQEYAEVTFAQVKAQMDQARKSIQDAQGSGQGGAGLPVSAEGCQWTDGKVTVEHPAGSEDIAGLATQRHVIRMQQSCTDPKTAKTCDITLQMDTWLAKKVPGEQEVTKFTRAYAEALGLGDVMRQVQGPGQSLLAMFATNWSGVEGEFKKLQGYPMRSVMQMDIGGEQCTTASGQPIAQDGSWADASGASVGEATGAAIGSSLAGSVGSAAGQLIGGLSGMFGQGAAQPAAQPSAQQAQAAAAGGQVMVFRITNEVTQWSEAPISPARFNVPEGWKKL
jgi:hypothetical protein